MILLYDYYQNIIINEPVCLVFGNFDGVHVGHNKLIQTMKSNKEYKTCIMTFSSKVVSDETIISTEEKIQKLSTYSPDYLVVIKTNPSFYNLSAHDFIDFLASIKVKMIVCGSDASFGAGKSGDVELLKKHFKVEVVDFARVFDSKISSSLIKSYGQDDPNTNYLLGNKTLIEGVVVHGNGLGDKLGFRTCNIETKTMDMKTGVYGCRVVIKNTSYLGIINIGINPTISKNKKLKYEVHILDFDEIVYGEYIVVELLLYLRDEQKFSSIDELKLQIKNDKDSFIKYIQSI